MNIKINTICFIVLLFLLIGVASATDADNETLQQKIEEPDSDICQISVDNQDALTASTVNNEKLEKSIVNEDTVGASKSGKEQKAAKSTTTKPKTKVRLKASNVKMYYNDGSSLTVTLKDSSKKPIKNAKIKIKISGKTYTEKTNAKGKASLKLSLNSGKYTAKVFYSGSTKYRAANDKCTITVQTTIKSSGLTKFYKNTAAHYATFYNKKGKVLKNTNVKFNINGNTYTAKTNNKGVAMLAIDLKPGNYIISQTNPKTSEIRTNIITIKTILETSNLIMTENDGSKFTVKVLDCNGKAAANKMVTVKVNGQTYTPTSNSQGIASQIMDLPVGNYSITTEYEGLVHTNQITVNKGLMQAPLSHITLIPDYVNVTVPYAFHNSEYVLKTGSEGIVKLRKNDAFAIHISETEYYLFTTFQTPGVDSIVLGHSTYLVPFDGSGVKSDYNPDNLKGDGILISRIENYTKIELRSMTQLDADLFSVTMDKGYDNIELITYLQNDLVKARVFFYTQYYDELGLKSNLGKLYDKSAIELDSQTYDYITANNADKIKFTNTGTTVSYSDDRKSILGSVPEEDVVTKLIVNGIEELEKIETITYGHSELYQVTRGFEVLQSYAIINDKVTRSTLERWLKVQDAFLLKFGINNMYGMFMASLETAWLADEIADQYAEDFNVQWKRAKTATVMAGINLKTTYIHILNADMGMKVSGSDENVKIFNLMNSYYLPYVEEYVLGPVAKRFAENMTNSLDNIYNSVENNNFSIVQMGEMFFIISEDGSNSAIVINSTSGVSNVLLLDEEFAYKGSSVPTACDCCSMSSVPYDILNGISDTANKINNLGNDILDYVMDHAHPLASYMYTVFNFAASVAAKLAPSATTGLASVIGLMLQVHKLGNDAKNNFMDEDSWHWAYKHVTFTRDSPLEAKKFFNIPKSDGTYDYIEVEINPDGSLNRNNALYVGDGYTRKLTKSETYNYFTEERWTACNIPHKYLKNEVPAWI